MNIISRYIIIRCFRNGMGSCYQPVLHIYGAVGKLCPFAAKIQGRIDIQRITVHFVNRCGTVSGIINSTVSRNNLVIAYIMVGPFVS